MWAGSDKSYLLSYVVIYIKLNNSGFLCQFEEKESQTICDMWIWLCIPSKSTSPKVSRSLVFISKCAVIFPLMTNVERSSGATSQLIQNLRNLFSISTNTWSCEGSLTVFHHLTVTLLSFLYAWYHSWDAPLVAPVMGRLALSLLVLCTNSSMLLSLRPSPPKKEFYLNSVKMDPVMLTWLCICK